MFCLEQCGSPIQGRFQLRIKVLLQVGHHLQAETVAAMGQILVAAIRPNWQLVLLAKLFGFPTV
jgi:hypothetical protein